MWDSKFHANALSLRLLLVSPASVAIACSNKVVSDKPTQAISGYIHTQHSSRFVLGDILEVRDENGQHKIVGSIGTFATDTFTNAALAIPNEPVPQLDTRYFPDDAGTQDAEVRSYFVSAGLPGEQAEFTKPFPTIQTRVPVLADGGLDYAHAASNTCWTSRLRRISNEVPIVDSVASAILTANGESVEESVYWPEIGVDTVREFTAFAQLLDEPQQRSAYLANLPSNVKGGDLIIRHTASDWHGGFIAVPCYRVTFSGVTLCFNIVGNEIHLPDGSSTPFE